VPPTGSRSPARRLPGRIFDPTTAGPPASRQEASAATICAAMVATLGIESNAWSIAGDGPPVRLTDRDGRAWSDRHDADGRSRPARPPGRRAAR
jgi:hypothetical protein